MPDAPVRRARSTWRWLPLGPCLLLPLILLLGNGCGDDVSKTDSDADQEPVSVGSHPDGLKERPERWEGLEDYADAPATAIRLRDATAKCGIDSINHSGRKGVKEWLVEAVGPGPAWFDYDGDGLLDVYLPDGDVLSNYTMRVILAADGDKEETARVVLEPKEKKPEIYRDTLWRNRGDGTFENVTDRARIFESAWSFGATAFDLEGDGDQDLYVSNLGKNVLWRNNGDGTFTDIAEAAGVQGDQWAWSTCCAVGDIDGDGRLDLYVSQYSDAGAEVEKQRAARGLGREVPPESIPGRACLWKSLPVYCGPRGLVAVHDVCFRQRSDNTFEDVTETWSLKPRQARYGFTTLMFDFNDDGLLDIYVANDSVENFMWQQERDEEGAIRFRDTSDTLGVKYGNNLNPQASMGAAVGDYNRDGLLDLFVTNFSHDYNNVYLGNRSAGRGTYFFKDRGLQLMGQAVFYDLSWGCGWIDFDNDRDLDLYFGNGHVYKEIDLHAKTGSSYEQLNSLFECMDAGHEGYREVGTKAQQNLSPRSRVDPKNLFAGDGMAVMKCSRAVAFADWNNDGRMELLASNMNDGFTLLLNATEVSSKRQWLKIVLSQPGGNREALGASVLVEAGGVKQRFVNVRQTSFLGCCDPRLHVGLGEAKTCRITVTWPGVERATSVYEGVPAGKLWQLDRKTGKAKDLGMKAFEVELDG